MIDNDDAHAYRRKHETRASDENLASSGRPFYRVKRNFIDTGGCMHLRHLYRVNLYPLSRAVN